MNKLKIKLFDGEFAHHTPGSSISSFPGHDVFPTYVEWIRDPNFECDYAFFTEGCLDQVDQFPSKHNFAWMIEPRALKPTTYQKISNPDLYNKFEMILTHDSELLKLSSKFVKCPLFGAWVSLEDSANYWPKTKNICIIASHKNQLPGHQLRHKIINELSQKYNIDVYGNGYKRFDKMVDVLREYRYCIVVENAKDGYWITEKLTTPMLCGCVPVYWGSPNIVDYFPGLQSFDSLEELKQILSMASQENYQFMVECGDVHRNFNRANKCRILEDHIFIKILQPWMCKE